MAVGAAVGRAAEVVWMIGEIIIEAASQVILPGSVRGMTDLLRGLVAMIGT